MARPIFKEFPSNGRSIALWVGVIGVPLIWLSQFQANYALAPWVCQTQGQIVVHLISAGCLVLALLGAYWSYRRWKRSGGGSPDTSEGGPVARERFLGALGAAVSVLLAMLILAQGIASFFFDGCWM